MTSTAATVRTSEIRQLSDSLINKIAAGEVIERPASVVKELLENSIDAGATQVEVVIDGGGIELIRIADNGSGIASDQLHLAVSPHATSKLLSADDLFAVQTLGFRGEALASIAEVSHLTLRSRIADQDQGAELVVRGGQREGPVPCGCPIGTSIEIRNLFYSTPVRRKFLKSAQTEMGHTLEAFTRIALANPNVQMTLRTPARVLQELPRTANWGERIHSFFGSEISDALIAVSSEDSGVRLRGYVVAPTVSRSNNRMQYLFLNGRYIRDRALQHALGEAYRGLLMVNRFPICFLHIDIAADQVDVNVHPTKSEVRFLDGGAIYSRLLQTLRSRFLSTDLTSHVNRPLTETTGSENKAIHPSGNETGNEAALSVSNHAFSEHERGLLQWARGEDPTFGQSPTMPELNRNVFSPLTPSFQPFPGGPTSAANRRLPASEVLNPSVDDHSQIQRRYDENPRSDSRASSVQANSHLGFQIHNRYLITQDDQGMVVIDQHALHERILYEQIREKVVAKKLETQRLLIPDPVTLTAAEAAIALENTAVLHELGVEIEPFGGDCVLITAYPAMLANIAPAEILRGVIEKLMADGAKVESRDLIDSLLHLIACKAAIKAGDRLTGEEITALLEQRYAYQDTHHCPHGRPTALHFSRNELDKLFKRT